MENEEYCPGCGRLKKELTFINEFGLEIKNYPTFYDKLRFVSYVHSFHGRNAEHLHNGIFMKKNDIWVFFEQYLSGQLEKHPEGTHRWGGGDTLDRNIVYESFLDQVGAIDEGGKIEE